MPSIQSLAYPLAYKLDPSVPLAAPPAAGGGDLVVRTLTRALDGMQKEAIVGDPEAGAAWRMVCDEGPWLNGTDLSSFPLGFFSAGLAAQLATEIVALATRRGVDAAGLSLLQTARYTMEGSAIKGTMTGTALPLQTEVTLPDGGANGIEALCAEALAASPADAVMRTALPSRFRITRNGAGIACGKVAPANMTDTTDPAALFDRARPGDTGEFAAGIIEKLAAGEPPPRHGAPVGYAAEQKRMLEVCAALTLRGDGLKVVDVYCVKPEGGSTFRFLSDDPPRFGGRGRAPSGLHYLSAGVAFCFMTQLGRYAGIVKQDLSAYRIVQDSRFSLPGASGGGGAPASAAPLETHVFLESSADDEATRMLVDMGEQTCYLHASYRGAAKTRLRVISRRAQDR